MYHHGHTTKLTRNTITVAWGNWHPVLPPHAFYQSLPTITRYCITRQWKNHITPAYSSSRGVTCAFRRVAACKKSRYGSVTPELQVVAGGTRRGRGGVVSARRGGGSSAMPRMRRHRPRNSWQVNVTAPPKQPLKEVGRQHDEEVARRRRQRLFKCRPRAATAGIGTRYGSGACKSPPTSTEMPAAPAAYMTTIRRVAQPHARRVAKARMVVVRWWGQRACGPAR